MTAIIQIRRPLTLREVAEQSDSLQSFGMNLRDWQHEIQRGGVHSRNELAKRLEQAPSLLATHFQGGDCADAYLAAYAEWLADKAGIPRPDWCGDPNRVSREPWFSMPVRGHLVAVTPASFRQRNLFTIPDAVFTPKPGRPGVPETQKREKSRSRQKRYRDRVRLTIERARQSIGIA